MNAVKLENFERAFTSSLSGCRRTCRCGRVFYDDYNSYDWEEGEFEELEADPKAKALDYSVGTIILEGTEYVADCECWHKRAETVAAFLDRHARQIAEYFRLEKLTAQATADAIPVIPNEKP